MPLFNYLTLWAGAAATFLLMVYLPPGFKVGNFFWALLAAIVMGIANALLWPTFMFIGLPPNLWILGFFTLVLNGVAIKLCASVLRGFKITSWLSVVFAATILCLVDGWIFFSLPRMGP